MKTEREKRLKRRVKNLREQLQVLGEMHDEMIDQVMALKQELMSLRGDTISFATRRLVQ